MKRWLMTVLFLALSGPLAWAQAKNQGVSDKITAQALTTASGGCLAVNPQRKTLALDNTGGSIAIGYCETSPSTPGTACTAAIGTAPTTTLAAGSLHYWPDAPVNQFCFIAASGTPSVTIKEGQ